MKEWRCAFTLVFTNSFFLQPEEWSIYLSILLGHWFKKNISSKPEFWIYLGTKSCRQQPYGIFETPWCLTALDFISAFFHMQFLKYFLKNGPLKLRKIVYIHTIVFKSRSCQSELMGSNEEWKSVYLFALYALTDTARCYFCF